MSGRRWGEESVWLHTEADNAGANALYQAAGYSVHSEGSQALPGFLTKALSFGGKDRLYWKALPPLRRTQNGAAVADDDLLHIEGAVRESDKVFVWDTVTVESQDSI